MSDETPVIQSLWVGNSLSAMELLTLKSFVDKGYSFNLWTYEALKTTIPKGVTVRNANEVLDFSAVFTYQHSNQYGHGKGSLAGFSDIFRYKLLYDLGGVWVDMDTTCLRFFDFSSPYFFRSHHDFAAVGNIMKCPANSPVMKFCFEEASKRVGSKNSDWDLPIRILNDGINQYDLTCYIDGGETCPPDQWGHIENYVFGNAEAYASYYFIHWLNEEWRTKGLNKNCGFSGSTYQSLLHEYVIPHRVKRPTLAYQMKLILNRLFSANT